MSANSRKKLYLIDPGLHKGLIDNCRAALPKYDLAVLNPTDTSSFEQLAEQMRANSPEIQAVISIGEAAFTERSPGQQLHEISDIPVVMYLGDSPADGLRTATNKFPRSLDRLVVATMCEEWGRMWRENVCEKSHICIVNGAGIARAQDVSIPQDERWAHQRQPAAICPINLIHYSMSNRALNADQIFDVAKGEGDAFLRRFSSVTEMALADFPLSNYEIVLRETADDPAFAALEQRMQLYYYANAFIKLRRRERLVSELVHLPVVFLGEGFPLSLIHRYNDRFSPIAHDNLIPYLKRAMFIIDPPQICDTIHERVVFGTRCGLLPIAQENPAMLRWFKHEDNCLLYNKSRSVTEIMRLYLGQARKVFDMWRSAHRTIELHGIAYESFWIIDAEVARLRKERGLGAN
ncbi:MAG: hypothetical protein K1X79_11950 [Oligoflexia bacterium]|nr:hypothetical protein [Oligoflexia bacterium]